MEATLPPTPGRSEQWNQAEEFSARVAFKAVTGEPGSFCIPIYRTFVLLSIPNIRNIPNF
jgi:hypothetical protein